MPATPSARSRSAGRARQGRVRPPDGLAGDRHASAGPDQAARRRRGARAGRQADRSRRPQPRVPRRSERLARQAHAVRRDGRLTSETRSTRRLVQVRARPACPSPARARSCGSRSRGDGSVTQLSDSLRQLERGEDVPIISPDEAQKACAALYDKGVRQGEPTLGYLLPALGAVEAIYPHYTCNPSTEEGNQAHRQVPAVEGAGPKAVVKASRSGDEDPRRRGRVRRRPRPYTLRVVVLDDDTRPQRRHAIAYERSSALQGDADETSRSRSPTSTASPDRVVSLPGDGTSRAAASPAAAASASSRSARSTSASSRPSTSGSARRTARSASRP